MTSSQTHRNQTKLVNVKKNKKQACVVCPNGFVVLCCLFVWTSNLSNKRSDRPWCPRSEELLQGPGSEGGGRTECPPVLTPDVPHGES